jgi:hypothetical protein
LVKIGAEGARGAHHYGFIEEMHPRFRDEAEDGGERPAQHARLAAPRPFSPSSTYTSTPTLRNRLHHSPVTGVHLERGWRHGRDELARWGI